MTRSVFANNRNFSHKGSGDKSNSTVPDICKTPIGTATPPIPYSVVSKAADAGGFSSSVFIDGNPTALESSSHTKCAGDAAGKANGLISGSTKEKSEFITSSFDVKTEGEGTVRHADMTTMNKTNTIGLVKGKSTSPEQIPDLEDVELAPPWIKLRANYGNSWQTAMPMENVKVLANGEERASGLSMVSGAAANTNSYTLPEAKETKDEPGTILVELEPGDTKITVVYEKTADVEKDVSDLQKQLNDDLKAAYLDTVDKMKCFQREWDTNSSAASLLAVYEGATDGISDWVEDQGELLEADTWTSMFSTLGGAISKGYNLAENYTETTLKEIDKAIEEVQEQIKKDPIKFIQETRDDIVRVKDEIAENTREFVGEIEDVIKESKDMASLLAKHQQEILKFPDYLADADVDAIENFIDTVITDMMPDLANDLKTSENYYIILEIIGDHDTALIYCNYLVKTLDAIPPNFYIFLAGKYGAYIALEILITIIISLFTAGVGGAAKVAAFTARILSGVKMAKAAKRLDNADKAIESLMKTIETFAQGANKLKSIGKLLAKRKEIKSQPAGANQTTIDNNKPEERIQSCSRCKKAGHAFTKRPKGNLEYV